jgi:hypothetical protein
MVSRASLRSLSLRSMADCWSDATPPESQQNDTVSALVTLFDHETLSSYWLYYLALTASELDTRAVLKVDAAHDAQI